MLTTELPCFHEQTVKTQILEEQFDQCLHCLPFGGISLPQSYFVGTFRVFGCLKNRKIMAV